MINGLFFTNICLSILFILYFKKNLFAATIGFFNFWFFGIIPLLENVSEVTYWGGAPLTEANIYNALKNIYLFNFCVFFGLKRTTKLNKKLFYGTEIKLTKINKIIILFYFFIVGFVFYKKMPFELFFFRRISAFNLETVFFEPSVYCIFYFFLKPTIFFSSFLVFLEKKSILIKSLAILSLFFIGFPTGNDRVLTAAFWLPILLIFLKKYNIMEISNLNVFFVYLIGTVSVFLGLESFRYKEGSTNFSFWNNLFGGHFDAFQILSRITSITPHYSLENLIGPLLFFIPRALWAEKPIGTSFLINSSLGLTHNNTSFPFVAELYFSFGTLAVLVGGFFVGYLCNLTWLLVNRVQNKRYPWFPTFVALSLCPFWLYVLRGNLLGAFSSTSIFLFSWLLLLFLLKKNEYFKKF